MHPFARAEYISKIEPVAVNQQRPYQPVESGLSVPQKGAKHTITATLYANEFTPQPNNIPIPLRGTRSRKRQVPYTEPGRLSAPNVAMLGRRIPSSVSDQISER